MFFFFLLFSSCQILIAKVEIAMDKYIVFVGQSVTDYCLDLYEVTHQTKQ